MNDRNYQLLNDLNQYDKALDDIYHNYAMRHGLSDTALWILYFVVSSGQDCTQTDISEQWSYRRQTVNSALKSLESHGFLSLEPLPDNSKSKRIHLTEKQPVEGCFAKTPSAHNDTPAQPQPQAMGAARREPGRGESPVKR